MGDSGQGQADGQEVRLEMDSDKVVKKEEDEPEGGKTAAIRAHSGSEEEGSHGGSTVGMEGMKPKADGFDLKNCCRAPTMEDVKAKVPIIDWLPHYDFKEDFINDIVSGITVGVMLIPQGMAYALLATLPPQYGLYSSVIPIIIYAFFGTSRQLAVGPVAIISLLVSEGIEAQGLETTEERVAYAMVLAFFVGLISAALGLVKAGIVSSFLSHSVLVGFTSGAACVIALSQLKHLLGFNIPTSPFPIETFFYALIHLPETQPAVVTMGLLSIFLLLALRWTKPILSKPLTEKDRPNSSPTALKVENGFRLFYKYFTAMGALIVVIIGTVVTTALYRDYGYNKSTLPIVGNVPPGYPVPKAPHFANIGPMVGDIFVSALVISILGFMESYAVADRYANKLGYRVDANQELFALGLANIIGSFFNSYPVTGGFSRTAVNEGAGARTLLSSIISAILVLIVILFMTQFFYYMPKNVLAAIVFVAVSSLFDFHAFKLAWRVDRNDFWVIMLTFLATLCLGTEIGLAIGFASSVVIVLHKLAFPHTAVVAQVQNEENGQLLYRNVSRFPDAKVIPGVLIFRFDSPLNFANTTHLKHRLCRAIKNTEFDKAESNGNHPAVILSFEGINSIDLAGLEVLEELTEMLEHKEVSFIGVAVKGPVRDAIEKHNTITKDVKIMPWLHKMDRQEREEFPLSFMSASIEEALHHLQLKKKTGASSTFADAKTTDESAVMSVI